MPIMIGVVGHKGGNGKTLLAFNIAERAHAAGYRVQLWDLDPKQGALHHMEWRSETARSAWSSEPVRIDAPPDRELAFTRSADVDLVICDFPGYDTNWSTAYMDRMDLLLAPLSTSAEDRSVMTPMGGLAQNRGWDFVFVPNNLRTSRARQDGLVTDLESGGYQVAPVRIGRWVALQDSAELGLGVCEYEPAGPAAAQIQSLWDWLAARVNLPRR
jgi:chromosome partitioning protein